MNSENILNINSIIEDYKNGIGAEKIALKYHVGKIKIKNILSENGVELKKRGGQKKEKKYIISDWRIEKYPNENGYHYIAIHKTDGITFNDYMNEGGFLTSYIKEKENIKIPSLYDRRKYYMETGNYWWEQWFTIEKRINKPTKKCPYCEWDTTDIENRSGAFEQHITIVHNKTVEEHLKCYPDDLNYFKVFHKKKEKELKLNNEKNFIICPICNQKLEKMTYWHLKSKHNMTITDFKTKFPDFIMLSENAYNQASCAFKEANLHVSKNKFISKYEKELCNMLDTLNIQYESSRQFLIGKEIDILVNDKKIGIEFDGLKWHTEWFGKKNHHYHLDKTKLCNEKGYGLIHIFEDEYVNKKEIVISKIKQILNINNTSNKIPARKCIIKEIYKHEAKSFLDKYHIQGFSSASIYLGAFYKNNLIAVMTFKNGNLKNKGWNLTRFASNINFVCQGIGGKLLKYFIRNYNPNLIISFADRRWTVNPYDNLYIKLGFSLDKFTSPDYKYYNENIDRYKRIHKMNFNKKFLSKKYGFPIEMTETEMAKELGYDRIWDCGLIKYVWKNN